MSLRIFPTGLVSSNQYYGLVSVSFLIFILLYILFPVSLQGKYYLKAEFLDVLDKPLGCFELYIQLYITGKKKRSLEIKLLTKA